MTTSPSIQTIVVGEDEVSLHDQITSWSHENESIAVFNGLHEHLDIPYLRWCRQEAKRLQPMYPNVRVAYKQRDGGRSQCCVWVPGLNWVGETKARYGAGKKGRDE